MCYINIDYYSMPEACNIMAKFNKTAPKCWNTSNKIHMTHNGEVIAHAHGTSHLPLEVEARERMIRMISRRFQSYEILDSCPKCDSMS